VITSIATINAIQINNTTLLVSHGVQGQSPCRSARDPLPGGQVILAKSFFFHFAPPAAAQNEN